MKIAIFGMGYVGVVSSACLLRDGHEVVGVDPVAAKVADLTQGRSLIQEPGVSEMLAEGHKAGRLSAFSANIGIITAGIIRSSNWSPLSGMEIDLNRSVITIGGSTAPKFLYDDGAVTLAGSLTIEGNQLTK